MIIIPACIYIYIYTHMYIAHACGHLQLATPVVMLRRVSRRIIITMCRQLLYMYDIIDTLDFECT